MVVMCGRHILYCLAGSGISLGFLWRILDGKQYASTSWTTNSVPSIKWDSNWDRRESTNLEKSPQKRDSGEVNQYNEQQEKAKPKASRHLILIQHGQSTTVSKDCDPKLTQLGREQANITGKRLKDLNFPYTRIVQSSMQRALETSQLIHVHIPGVKVETCCLLQEGAPIPPEPPIDHWRPKPENLNFRTFTKMVPGLKLLSGNTFTEHCQTKKVILMTY
ncbi:serine/threonine-protein phosphatase Pgam5, mitochondrial-like isoform X2 [Tachypleus tridentatus]|uniref:serine/threonine-protein phosphatase Pgam5, mitochondrial-like isoform X2 n=1 Tax=Tachypleus tridentatus TaxID=6853 RepID=UPI003FD58094